MGYMIIMGIFTAIGWVISNRLKSKMSRYSQVANSARLTGEQVAHAMMDHYGVSGVKVVEGRGTLTDHYNPKTRTVALSPAIFNGKSVAAAAVAAHEVGHVVQHATAYKYLEMRSNLVPIVQFSSRIQQFLFMGLMIGMGSGMMADWMLMILAGTFGATALFSMVTLPVEFDASKRALAWLDETGIAAGEEYDGAKDALWWAAMTYVAQALSALVMFLYFLLMALGKRD